MAEIGSKVKKAITQPYKIPGYVKRRVDNILNSVEGTRIIWPQAGRAYLEDFGLRRPLGHEVLVKTHTTLVSAGTERAMFAKLPNTKVEYPYYPGYSGSGEVLMVGEEVTRFQPGDRVAGSFPHWSINLYEEDQLNLIPDGVTMAQASFYHVGVIALQGVRKAGIELGERAAIIGPGLIGLIALQLTVAAGAYPVTVIASSNRRLPLGLTYGAHAAINLAEGREALDEVQADVTIDVTGSPEAIHDAIRCTRPGGRIVLLGSSRGVTRQIDFDRVREAGLTLVGAHIMSLPQREKLSGWWPLPAEGEALLQLMADGRLQVDQLLTDELTPAEPELFYRRLAEGDSSVLAAAFRWDKLKESRRFAAPRREALEQGRLLAAVLGNRLPTNGKTPHEVVEAPASSTATTSTKESVLRIGMIGCGEIAVQNALAIERAGNAVLTAVMDVNKAIAEDMAKRHNVPYTTAAEDLLKRDDVDAVLISVPHFLHAPLAIQAAQAGKHVMVEKPMANTLAEADAMLSAAQAAGVKLSVIYCQRYLPYIQKAKQMIDQGALGKLLGLNLTHYLDKPVSYWTGGRTGRVTTDWRLSKEKGGGGVLVFNLVHYLDIIRYLTGQEVVKAYSEYGTFDSPSETEDTISVTLRYDNQLVGNITAASCVRGADMSHQQLHIWGTEGQLIIGEPMKFYSLRQFEDYNPAQWHTLADWDWGIERRDYVRQFANAVLHDEEPGSSGRDGRVVQAIVEAIYTSQLENKPITLEAVSR